MVNLGEEGAFTITSDMSMMSSFRFLMDAGTWPCSDLQWELLAVSLVMHHGGRSRQSWIEKHWRGVCSREGYGAHAIEHGKYAGGDIQLRGACSVGACMELHGFALGGGEMDQGGLRAGV